MIQRSSTLRDKTITNIWLIDRHMSASDVYRKQNVDFLQTKPNIFANSVDLDEKARNDSSHQDLRFLQFTLFAI